MRLFEGFVCLICLFLFVFGFICLFVSLFVCVCCVFACTRVSVFMRIRVNPYTCIQNHTTNSIRRDSLRPHNTREKTRRAITLIDEDIGRVLRRFYGVPRVRDGSETPLVHVLLRVPLEAEQRELAMLHVRHVLYAVRIVRRRQHQEILVETQIPEGLSEGGGQGLGRKW